MKLWRYTVRQVRSRPARAFLTLLSIVLGVAAVVSVSMATRATRRAYQGMFQAMTGKADLEISGLAGATFPQDEVLSWLPTLPGVRAATPIVMMRAIMYYHARGSEDLENVTTTFLAIDPDSDGQFRDIRIKQGEFFRNGTGVLLEEGFARSLQVQIGDRVSMHASKKQIKNLEIVGLFEARGAAAIAQGGMVVIPLPIAQARVFGASGRTKKPVTAVHVLLSPHADLERTRGLIAQRLKQIHEAEVEKERAELDSDADEAEFLPRHKELAVRPPAARTQLAEETQLTTEMGLRMATALSLVVAVFIILNTFLINVSERRRQLGIMRAIGATQSQITGMLLGEGLAMGVLGTALGAIAGLVGAYFLTLAMTQLARASLPALELTAEPFLLGAAFGLGISLAGTYLPARRAGKLSPLEGMAALAPEDRDGFPPVYTVIGSLIVSITAVGLVGCIMGWLPIDFTVTLAVTGLVGLVLLIPTSITGLTAIATTFLVPILGFEGRLAQRQILRRRTRTSLTIGVLFVAISTGIGMASALIDNVHDVQDWYHRTVVGDYFIRAMMPDSQAGALPEIPPRLAEEINAIDGIRQIESVSWSRTDVRHPAPAPGESEPKTEQVMVVCREFKDPNFVSLDLVEGSTKEVRAGLSRGEVVIGTVLAQKMNLHRGDEIRIDTPRGEHRFRIAGTTNEYNFGGLAVYIERQAAAKFFDIDGVDAYIIQAQPDRVVQVGEELERICQHREQVAENKPEPEDAAGQEGEENVDDSEEEQTARLLVLSFKDIARLIDGLMAGVVGCLWGLLALGFIVAAFGIANTLTMNVLEQTRELGLLRIVAMTRQQVRRTIFGQAAIMGFLGLVPGILAGVAMAWLINRATLPGTGHPIEFEFHPGMMALAFAVAFVIVVIAAWAPAERAARLELVQALQYE